MLYVFEIDNKIMVSNVDPDGCEDMHKLESEGFYIAPMLRDRKTPMATLKNIICNQLRNGGAQVTSR